MNRAELKADAKQQIQGNIGMYFLCVLLVSVIASLSNIVPVIGCILVTGPLTLGLYKVTLEVSNGGSAEINTLFSGFNQFGPSTILFIMITIFTTLWSLLFFIPGIVKALSYSMSYFILAENPDMTPSQALDESKRIMDGRKMDLFILELSFLPWLLLTGITFGIAIIYVGPYMYTTIANFYKEIKNN